MDAEAKLRELGHELPVVGKPLFSYVPFRRAGDTVYISGQVPRLADGSLITGQVGTVLDLEAARKAALLCGLHILAVARAAGAGAQSATCQGYGAGACSASTPKGQQVCDILNRKGQS